MNFKKERERFNSFGYELVRDKDQHPGDYLTWVWTMRKKYAAYRMDGMLGVLCADTIEELFDLIGQKHMSLYNF